MATQSHATDKPEEQSKIEQPETGGVQAQSSTGSFKVLVVQPKTGAQPATMSFGQPPTIEND